MDDLLASIKASTDPAALLPVLRAAEDLIKRAQASLAQALEELQPALHSLGYLFLLAQLSSGNLSQAASEAFVARAARFVQECSAPQIRLEPAKFCLVCRKLKEHWLARHEPRRLIPPLRAALAKLLPGPEFITPLHADLFQTCLLAKCLRAALPALLPDKLGVDPARTALTHRDFLLYCYYGGLIHIGRKEYAAAQRTLLQALVAPCTHPNSITLACHRQHFLVNLLLKGCPPTLPRYAPTWLAKAFKAEHQPLLELGQALEKGPPGALAECLQKHRAAWQADGSLGLVQLAAGAQVARAVQQLTETYQTLPLAQIAASTGLPSPQAAHLLVLQMIDAGEVHARIDEGPGVVQFFEAPEGYADAATLRRLHSVLAQAKGLQDQLQELTRQLALHPQYIAATSQGSKGGGPPRGKLGDITAEMMDFQEGSDVEPDALPPGVQMD